MARRLVGVIEGTGLLAGGGGYEALIDRDFRAFGIN